jgi:hypothetical protein
LISTLFHDLHALQVSCERFDAKALFKKWDSVFITVASSFMAYGSTEEKAVSRALGRGSSAEAHTVMPIAGCVCTAAAHDGKSHAMFVKFPAMPGVPEQCFAFATSAARDSFMRAVQSRSVPLSAPSTSAPTLAAKAQNLEGGNALAEVTCPTL